MEKIEKVLLLGSGALKIGEAGEFDYSGSQALKAMREEGIKTVLINPNIATVQTSEGVADKIYFLPVTPYFVEQVIKRERPQGILLAFGGQTALNCGVELYRNGVLEKYDVQVLGTPVQAIMDTEDRELFVKKLDEINVKTIKSHAVENIEDAKAAASELGYPVIIRAAYALGGLGSGFCNNEDELEKLAQKAFTFSPQILVEKSLKGWKEIEYEIVRDKYNNCIAVCNMENFDPLGIHTGESIVVAPSQTLTNDEFHILREIAIKIVRHVGIVGECNVQYAFDPESEDYRVIEVNARLSRSSALASKATGYPLAFVAAKLGLGYGLFELKNSVTKNTPAFFEPALDYVAVKVPRFELEKFPLEASALGTQMRSVGETLALGRTALEAMNKAFRSSEQKLEGIVPLDEKKYDADLLLRSAHPLRYLAAFTAIKKGETDLEKLSRITGFDIYFLSLLMEEKMLEDELEKGNLTKDLYLKAKQAGLSDKHIEELSGCKRPEHLVCSRHYVDTCAGEFEALTPYCYTSYGEEDEGEGLGENAVIIIASGPNRIGQGLEFDTCCTLSSKAFRRHGRKTVMINSNPETVSTDYNTSDRLYISPLTAEDVLAIMEKEGTKDVVVQLGGQTPLNMAAELEKNGAHIIGTSLSSIDETEDRGLFSALVKKLNLRQPENRSAGSISEIKDKAHEIGFPVLLRPSFVLGGRAMFIAYDDEGLEEFIKKPEVTVSPDSPVLVDQFLEDAFEYDLDAVSDGKSVYIGGILQHIEAAGIHSGDSAAVFPPYKSKPEILQEMKEWTLRLARHLNVQGLMNIQFAEKDGKLYIIEVNPRASRTVPFISKSSGVDLVEAAVRVWQGESLVSQGLVKEEGSYAEGRCITGWAIKEAVFSFDRFPHIDPALGPEMRSTGEVVGYGRTFGEAYAKSQAAAFNKLPTKGRVIISVNSKDRATIVPIAKALEEMGFHILATKGTARDLYSAGILADVVLKTHDGHPNIVDYIRERKADLIINTPMGFRSRQSDDDIRTEAVKAHIPYTTTTSAARAAVEAIRYLQENRFIVRELPRGSR